MTRRSALFGFVLVLAALFGGAAMAGYADGLRAFEEGRFGEAADQWAVAANAGHVEAQYRYGLLLEEGRGVPQNYVRAHAWLNLATAQGHEGAREARDGLTRQMTPEQLAQAQDMAARWRPARNAEAPVYETPAEVGASGTPWRDKSEPIIRHTFRHSLWR